MRAGWALAAGAVLLGACGTGSDAVQTADTNTDDTIAVSTTEDGTSHIVSDERGAAVIVTGTLGPGATLCPQGETDCDYGLVIDGAIGDVAVGDFVEGQGWYDGRRVALAAPFTRHESPFRQLAPRELCSTQSSSTSAPPQIPLCLAEDAAFSEQDLLDASSKVSDMVTHGVFSVEGGYGLDEIRDRVVVPIEALDAAGRAAVDQVPAVVAVPFIELLDRPVSELPAWQSAVAGTVDLITEAGRFRGGLAALGTFTVHFDAASNCLYTELEDQRGTFVWPFGYSATATDGVVTVFDAGGSPVATSVVPVQLGGGEGDTMGGVATGDNRCGATMFWFVAGG